MPYAASKYQEEEKRINKYIRLSRKEKKVNLTAVARSIDVPVRRLRARVQGRSSMFGRAPTNRALNNAEEEALIG